MNTNLVELTKINNDCASYTGTVIIASYLGDRLISKETCHNAGLKNLFEFIGSCLQGNWYEARDKRPCKLVMFTKGTEEKLQIDGGLEPLQGWSVPDNTKATDSRNDHYWSSKYAVCSPIMYDTAAISTANATSNSTTYHFRVPFLSLVGGAKIKKLMLLPPVATDYPMDACAYFILEEEIPVPEAGANFTVIIDWTLTFNNSVKKTS